MSQKKNVPNENRTGQHFINLHLVTEEQLAVALKRQLQTGERLGSILLQMGYITTETLLTFLKDFYNTPSIDLYKVTIEHSVLQIISHEQMSRFQAIPILNSNKILFVAMADPDDIDSVNELEFIIGKKLQPVAVPHAQLSTVIEFIRRKGGKIKENLSGEIIEKEMAVATEEEVSSDVNELLKQLVKQNASDLLISAGIPPCLKIYDEVCRLALPALLPADVEAMARELMTPRQWEEFDKNGGLDFGFLKQELGRFRVNVYRQRSSVSIVIRSIAERIPSLQALGFSEDLEEFISKPQGLIIVTGPTGHGKSTTLASMIDAINSKRKCNIITIEDPIEFLHKHKMSNINQREVGKDTPTFREGLKNIFRQAPDVIVIGEMRDHESFEIAIQAAGSGHLVISSMQANNTTSAIDRILDMFSDEKQDQIRNHIAEDLVLCLGQRLVPSITGKGRVLAYEKLSSSARVKNLIRENKCHQIRTFFQQSVDEYMSIDISLANLVKLNRITFEEGARFCDNMSTYKMAVAQGTSRP